MHPFLNTAITAARSAGKIMIRAFERLDSLQIQTKGENDFVTNIDFEAETEIMNIIRTAYPSHAFLTEESGSSGNDDFTWIIDPLDGTTNYIHGLPFFAVSIAVKYRDKIEQGVVFNPFTQELFTASRGEGAFLNHHRVRVSQQKELSKSFLATGFPYRNPKYINLQLKIIETVFPHVSGFRALGSAALALAYTAAGKFDGVWLNCLSSWDLAAGRLLIQEAGGLVGNFAGVEDFKEGNFVGGNPKIFKALLQIIQQCSVG
jgi:myo-inositol-1(or 4)-monophosphatase